ncbi:pectinesterase inhibitor 10 isoform X1 [Triticum aestivum]|uniref:pectinesterase inhibitor 10 isoform X1 n=1 Tax=Triticum aestivum TaxID=4565 RepID=UPI001D0084AA|nr:pectinesterase inhibitor 10-like isoform X1 [Triticum aestivum]
MIHPQSSSHMAPLADQIATASSPPASTSEPPPPSPLPSPHSFISSSPPLLPSRRHPPFPSANNHSHAVSHLKPAAAALTSGSCSPAPPLPSIDGDVAMEAYATGTPLTRSRSSENCSAREDARTRTEENELHIWMKVSNPLWCHDMDVVLAAGVLSKERLAAKISWMLYSWDRKNMGYLWHF